MCCIVSYLPCYLPWFLFVLVSAPFSLCLTTCSSVLLSLWFLCRLCCSSSFRGPHFPPFLGCVFSHLWLQLSGCLSTSLQLFVSSLFFLFLFLVPSLIFHFLSSSVVYQLFFLTFCTFYLHYAFLFLSVHFYFYPISFLFIFCIFHLLRRSLFSTVRFHHHCFIQSLCMVLWFLSFYSSVLSLFESLILYCLCIFQLSLCTIYYDV